MRKAIHAAWRSKEPTEIVFKPLRYVFDSASGKDRISRSLRAALTLSRMTNVVLNGNGAEIPIHKPRLGFLAVLDCQNAFVKE